MHLLRTGRGCRLLKRFLVTAVAVGSVCVSLPQTGHIGLVGLTAVPPDWHPTDDQTTVAQTTAKMPTRNAFLACAPMTHLLNRIPWRYRSLCPFRPFTNSPGSHVVVLFVESPMCVVRPLPGPVHRAANRVCTHRWSWLHWRTCQPNVGRILRGDQSLWNVRNRRT